MPSVEDQVIDFYYGLFGRVFTEPFCNRITERLKRDSVSRQVQDAAGAASQSLTRFLLNEQLSEENATLLLGSFASLRDVLNLEDVTNPNVPPETVVKEILARMPCPPEMKINGKDALYRLALHSVVQVLMLVGPVLVEWQKVNFSRTFEPSRRIVSKLNQISEQLGALLPSGQDAADERFELSYRDFLLQRFHRIEAGTVRMTTSQDVSLPELFVTPRVSARTSRTETQPIPDTTNQEFMDLDAARRRFAEDEDTKSPDQKRGRSAVDQIRTKSRNVIVGAPGSGKSTFMEWLQLKLAGGEQELIMGGQQAIPLLLRVRQLNPLDLPQVAKVIETATGSKDITALMPPGWMDRQMKEGLVFFMLDGLDEVEPDFRDNKLLPWLEAICQRYARCRYLISSRPEGYPPGRLRRLRFAECDLLDFDEQQVAEFARHWCTAVRLARNEPEAEARREGEVDGKQIVDGFKQHPFTRNLARNPLMLSAICLVNYFEGGQLPKDRAVLYGLCVEGLLHNWDQRRGIRSEFGFEEKLRACREVAVKMQTDNRAEYEAPKVQAIFSEVLDDSLRAQKLLEHIRRRTGLLLERRSGVFAFAHLTFQEYLAARAVHEGNGEGVTIERLAAEHDDGRWKEVIALYCGLVPAPDARKLIETLIGHDDSLSLGSVLAEAYLSARQGITQDVALRKRVIERISVAPGSWPAALVRFPREEVAVIANATIGTTPCHSGLSGAQRWFAMNPKHVDGTALLARLMKWKSMTPLQMSELVYVLHAGGDDALLEALSERDEIYSAEGPSFRHEESSQKNRSSATRHYLSQAEVAILGLFEGSAPASQLDNGHLKALIKILNTLGDSGVGEPSAIETHGVMISKRLSDQKEKLARSDPAIWQDLIRAVRKFSDRNAKVLGPVANNLSSLADYLEHRTRPKEGQLAKPARKRSSEPPRKR